MSNIYPFNNEGRLFAGLHGDITVKQGHVYLEGECLARFADTATAVKELSENGWIVADTVTLTKAKPIPSAPAAMAWGRAHSQS